MKAAVNRIVEGLALLLGATVTWLMLLGWGCVRVESEAGHSITFHGLPCIFSGGCDME